MAWMRCESCGSTEVFDEDHHYRIRFVLTEADHLEWVAVCLDCYPIHDEEEEGD